jgi:hypothetical protein
MNGRRREQFKGIYPGPYRAGTPSKTDVAVTAEGPEGPVVVGRFYATKSIDAEAQANAYAAIPEMIDVLKSVALHGADPVLGVRALELLAALGIEL